MMRVSFKVLLCCIWLFIGPWSPPSFSSAFSTRATVGKQMARPSLVSSKTILKRSSSQLDQLKLSSASIEWKQPKIQQRLFNGMRRAINSVTRNEVTQWRLVFGTLLGSAVLFRKIWDNKLVLLWDHLLHSQSLFARIFRTDSWEWCWAISCFAVYIHAFGWADRLVRRADQEGRIHPWKKFRLQDRYEADRQRRMFDKRGNGLQSQNDVHGTAEEALRLDVPHSPWNWRAWLQELPVYAVPLLTWDIVAPRRHRRIGGFGPPSTMGILGGVLGGLFLYDFLFFLGHVAMHKIPFLNRTIHAKHHKITEVRACEIVQLSVAEEVLEVGFSIIALNLLGVHPVARSIYNAIITFLLTELHCGFDFPWTPQNVVPFGLATGSRRHHYHHRNGKHYYQKFFHHVDYLFNFYQRNDGSLQGDSVQAKPYIPSAWKRT